MAVKKEEKKPFASKRGVAVRRWEGKKGLRDFGNPRIVTPGSDEWDQEVFIPLLFPLSTLARFF